MRTTRLTAAFLLSLLCCDAQETAAPTPDSVGSTRGENWTDYNIVDSFETGYRFLSLSGNQAKYRSDENFGSGVRLLSSFFSMNSKNGHGLLFDELTVTTNGLGGDPYESATVRLSKNKLYQYNLLWRKNDYYNPGLTTDGGQGENLLDTSYTMQDHNLTLFPESNIRFTLGYTRNVQSGAGISSVQLFDTNSSEDPSGNIFPIFSNVKIVQNEFRLGGEVHWHGFTLNVLHGWQDFKDDTPLEFNGNATSGGPTGVASLSSFLRTAPNHGTSPYWQAALFRNTRWFNFNGRFTYTGGVRDFLTNETALGTNQFGALSNQQIITAGNAQRPVATGNVNLTVMPTSKLTIATRVSIYNVRTEGNSAYLQYDNSTQADDLLYFQYLGIRTFETDIDAQYQLKKWLDVHGGYGYSDRRIASSPQFAITGQTPGTPYIQTSVLNSGFFGFRIRPLKGLTAVVDGEFGRANRPFTPKSDQNYTTISATLQYKWKRLQLSALTHTDYNLNSVTLSNYSSHARTYSGSVSWSLGSGFAIDGTFSKLHVDTLGGIAFFANSQFLPNQLSYYVSNLYSGTLGLRYAYKRMDLYAGYNHVQDLGDGRSNPTTTVIGPNLAPFQTAQTFPLRFLAPMGRLSFRITEKIRWNVGYEYYGYREDFFSGQNYLAHTGYTSLLWSF
ncbi:MAG TPA: hypothetical protein VHZ55_02515 [Bryobacteraceae bacterium]|nr:hypothetical protein [Bryobacteraceae bacterium]